MIVADTSRTDSASFIQSFLTNFPFQLTTTLPMLKVCVGLTTVQETFLERAVEAEDILSVMGGSPGELSEVLVT